MYNGPSLQVHNLSNPRVLSAILSLSQAIDLEEDPNKQCKNYPYKNFKTYKECDDFYMKQELKKYQLIPFWSTNNLSSVTQLR